MTYIALFRGINVGGNNILPMRDLVRVLTDLGLRDVKTYIQSGNVVFESEPTNTSDLAEKIGLTIAKMHGFTPKVLILTHQELKDAVAANPFPEAEHEPKTLHLFFLVSKSKPDRDALGRLKTAAEQFKLTETVFYLHAPNGIGRSKLAAKVERVLGTSATARNWQTLKKILALSAA